MIIHVCTNTFSLPCRVTVHFLTGNGERQSAKAKVGDNLLDVIIENEIDIDGFGMIIWFLNL